MEGKFVILVAEKSQYVGEFIRREFMDAGYEVQLAKDQRRMFEFLDTDDPADLLVLDLNLPYNGGIELLERMHNRVPPVPVIVYSMFAEHGVHPAVKAADAFVEKEAGPAALLESVDTVMRNRYPERFGGAGNGE